MNPETQMTLDLRSHLALNTDLLGHLERESQNLRQLESDQPTSAAEASSSSYLDSRRRFKEFETTAATGSH